MNIELTLAIIVLFFGVRIILSVLKSGSPENAIKLAEEKLEKNKLAVKNKSAYALAWFASISIGLLFVWLSLTYIYSLA